MAWREASSNGERARLRTAFPGEVWDTALPFLQSLRRWFATVRDR